MKNTHSTYGSDCETEFPLLEFASGQMLLQSPFCLPEQIGSCRLRLASAIQEILREAESPPVFHVIQLCILSHSL